MPEPNLLRATRFGRYRSGLSGPHRVTGPRRPCIRYAVMRAGALPRPLHSGRHRSDSAHGLRFHRRGGPCDAGPRRRYAGRDAYIRSRFGRRVAPSGEHYCDKKA